MKRHPERWRWTSPRIPNYSVLSVHRHPDVLTDVNTNRARIVRFQKLAPRGFLLSANINAHRQEGWVWPADCKNARGTLTDIMRHYREFTASAALLGNRARAQRYTHTHTYTQIMLFCVLTNKLKYCRSKWLNIHWCITPIPPTV